MDSTAKPTRPEVISIGVTDKGNSVIRLMVNGRRLDADTNLVSFARLAAEGVKVENGGK